MIHRHLVVPASTPVDDLPSAAILDLLERGDLKDWAPLLDAISLNPRGPLASRVMKLVDEFPMYGTSPLLRAWIDRSRARTGGSEAAPLALADLRRAQGLTQAEVAERAGMSQSDLSKLERRGDMRLSTLRLFARALGGRLRVLFARRGGTCEVAIESPQSLSDSS